MVPSAPIVIDDDFGSREQNLNPARSVKAGRSLRMIRTDDHKDSITVS
jgi:hypothetical protein